MKGSGSLGEALLESLSTAVSLQKIVLDKNGKPVDFVLIQANPAFASLLNHDLKKITDKPASEIWPGILNKKEFDWMNFYASVALEGKTGSKEFYSASTRKWLLVNASSPKKGYFVTEFYDITKIKNISEQLRSSEENFKKIVETSAEGILEENSEQVIVYVNREMTGMLGYSREEIIGKKFSHFLFEEDIPDHESRMEKRKKGVNEAYERRLRRKDGKECLVHISAVSVLDNEKNFHGSFAMMIDITERRTAQNAMALSEKRLRQIIDLVPHFIFAKDLYGKFILVNKAVADAYGTTVKDLTGKTDADFAKSEEEVIHFRKDDDYVIKSGKPKIVLEEPITDAKGITRKLNTVKIPFTFSGTSLPAILGVSVDITEIKEKEQALHESERRLYTLMSHLPGIAYRCKNDTDWTMEFISEGCLNLTGYSVDDLLHNRILSYNDIIHPDDRQMVWDVVQENIDNKTPYKLIYRIVTSSGEEKWVWEQGSGVFADTGELLALEGFIADITEQKNAEQELQKKEQLLRIFFDSPGVMRALVEIKDKDVRILNINNDLLEYFRKAFGDVVNRDFRELGIPEDIIELWIENCYKSRESGKSVHFEYKGMKDDWMSTTVTFIEPANNGGLYIIVFRDISEKQNLIEELVRAKEKAEELSRIKSNFLANMSHELRTPMVGILGFSEILSGEITDPELQEYANLIHQGGTRLMDTLNLILDLSLIESDKLNVIISDFDLINEISEVLRLFRKTAAKKNLNLKLVSEKEIFTVYQDKRLTRQIFNNLINNAIKYTNSGSIIVTVKDVVYKGVQSAEIKVTDTGIGIPDNMRDMIWEEFRQVSEGYGRLFEGTGLGLSISRKFVGLLGGSIFLENTELDKGTTFTVLLPVKSVNSGINTEPGQENSEAIKIFSKTVSRNMESKHVLYVEDEKSSIALVKAYLKNYCALDVAHNATEAIEKVKNNTYSVILMDINLGIDIDGIQATQKIRMIPGYEKTPVVAITAFAMEKEKEEFLKKGCTHYISKPFEKNNFIALLGKIFEEQQK